MKEYFQHDYNARNDRKLTKLRITHKMTGIGIYWSLVEMLYEEKGEMLFADLPSIADELRTDPEVLKSVIKDFGLFEFDRKSFWSDRIKLKLIERKEKSIKAKESITKRWSDVAKNKALSDTNVLQTNNDRNTIIREDSIREDKIEEEKKENIITPDAAAPVENKSVFNLSKNAFLIFYKENLKSDYYFEAKDGAKIKSLLKKIEFQVKAKCEKTKEIFDPDSIPLAFEYFITQAFKKSDKWVLDHFTLSTLDSKFNDIFNLIQNGKAANNNQRESNLSAAERASALYR